TMEKVDFKVRVADLGDDLAGVCGAFVWARKEGGSVERLTALQHIRSVPQNVEIKTGVRPEFFPRRGIFLIMLGPQVNRLPANNHRAGLGQSPENRLDFMQAASRVHSVGKGSSRPENTICEACGRARFVSW